MFSAFVYMYSYTIEIVEILAKFQGKSVLNIYLYLGINLGEFKKSPDQLTD